MQRYAQYARQSGAATPAGGATVEVFDHGTLVAATIYSDNLDPATPKSNPFTADADGFFYFYAEPGRYDVRISGAGVTSPYVWADVLLIADAEVAYADRANTFVGTQTITGSLVVSGGGTFGTPAVPLITSDGKIAALTSAYVASLNASTLTALNATELTSGTVPNARLSGTYASALTLSNSANVLAGASLALGAVPAGTGAIRLTFNEAISARNQANSSDVALLRLSTDNYALLVAAKTQQLIPQADDVYALGAADARFAEAFLMELGIDSWLGVGPLADRATTGGVRLPNGATYAIVWRNAAGSANIGSLYATAADKLRVDMPAMITEDLESLNDNGEDLGGTSTRYRTARLGTAVAIGTNPAATGGLRLANDLKAVGRNAANNADIDLFALDAADYFRIYRKTRYDGPQSTGGGSAALSTNCPAVTPSAPYTWFEVMTSDGSVGFIPVWK